MRPLGTTGFDDLSVTIPHADQWVPALGHVSLELRPGQIQALVGESGAGKSVLGCLLSGLVPPHSRIDGRLLVDGRDLTPFVGQPRHPVWRAVRGRLVGAVGQSAATSFTPTRTLGSQLAEVVRVLGGAESVPELSRCVNLPLWALDAYPHEVSGGMAQRAALAAGLAGQPRVLVADEPTSALDAELTAEVLFLLRAQADRGVAVLLVTHDLGSLLDRRIADEVCVLRAGRVQEQGPAEQVLGNPTAAYTRDLLAALPRFWREP